jgi:ankyrin repeat protein
VKTGATILNHVIKLAIALPVFIAILISMGNAFQENCEDKFIAEAAAGNNLMLIKMLKKGTSVNSKNYEGQTALISAALKNKTDTLNLLISKGADLNQRGKQARTALMWAAISGNLESVQSLLTNGADVNQRDRKNQTALMFAAQRGNLVMVEILLQSGADPLARDMNCATPNAMAIEKGFLKVAKVISDFETSTQSSLDEDDIRTGAYL